MTDRFRHCLDVVLEHEGGLANHPADRGGLTYCGITAMTWARAQRAGAAPKGRPLVAATATDIMRVYELLYWVPSHAPKLPPPLDLLTFDAWVNHRPGVAAEFLQAAVGVPMDGIIGPVTLRAAAEVNPRAAAAAYFRARRAFYARLIAADPSQKVFRKGWENRMRSLERAAAADLPPEPEAR